MPEGVSGLLSPWVKSRRHQRALSYLRAGMAVLDVGCGLGELCRRLPGGIRYTGIDREPAFIARCRRRYPTHAFLEGDFFDLLPQLAGGLDAVLLTAVLEHAPRPEAFFPAARSLLKPGGLLLVTTPAPRSGAWHAWGVRLGLLSPWAEREHHGLLGPDLVLRLGEAAGFRLVRRESFLFGLNQFFAFARRGE